MTASSLCGRLKQSMEAFVPAAFPADDVTILEGEQLAAISLCSAAGGGTMNVSVILYPTRALEVWRCVLWMAFIIEANVCLA